MYGSLDFVDGFSFWPATGFSQPGYFHLRDSTLTDVIARSYVWYPESDVHIERNVFVRSAGFSVGHRDADVYVTNNRFVSRTPGYDYWVENWAAYDSSTTIVMYNSFLDTDEPALRLPSGYSSTAMLAPNNYWGTTDDTEIQARIIDLNDDITIAATIPYEPFLLEPDPSTP